MMTNNIWKFFLENAPIGDIKRFCEENGYCLVILDSTTYRLEKEYGR